jgi:uncharacterized membrane protein YoaK (UPF0700 family)
MTANYVDGPVADPNTALLLQFGVPIALIVIGILLGFLLRRKDRDEKFRVSPLVVCAAFALLMFLAGGPHKPG